ncbi:MAG TPA: YggS family pyridoxal phosphate-dependent enzyme [Anaerolineaceae bacterium]|nr:YggS family pyridoxal phosphate-dependent enzyme [Anaerolineaceae bacterium]
MNNEVISNYKRTFESINEFAIKVGRDPDSIKLIVVTKAQPVEKIISVINAGAKYLGENYPEETLEKMNKLENLEEKIEWHMIGHLQSRKASIVASKFNYLHSLDSLKLALKLDRQLIENNKTLDALLQFNVGGEISKFGWDAFDPNNWNLFDDEIHKIVESCKNLRIVGLMTMPPYSTDEKTSRNYFHTMLKLGEYLTNKIPGIKMIEYSMGTSHDYKAAILEGATMVRVGTAIMGTRD